MAIGAIPSQIGAGAAPAGGGGSSQVERLEKQMALLEKKLAALRSSQGNPDEIKDLEKRIEELERQIEEARRAEDKNVPEDAGRTKPDDERRFDRYEKGGQEKAEDAGIYYPPENIEEKNEETGEG